MKKFIKLIPVFLLLCLISINVNAQDSTSLCLEELNTDVYEDILTEYYEVESGYAYCSSAVSLTSSVEITEDVTVTIPDAYGSNVWRVDTSLDAADSNCTVVELDNNFYYLSAVSDAVFTDKGVTFSTNKLGIYITGGCFSEEDIENFSTGTSNFSIDESTLTQDGTWLGASYSLLDEDGDGVKETVYVYGTMTDTRLVTSSNYKTYGFYKVLSAHSTVTKAIVNCSLGSRTNTTYMFYKCDEFNKLISLKFGTNFNTSNVTNMSYMFEYCESLTTLDMSNFDTSKVTDMSYMFYDCSSLISLYLSSFNTSKVTSMSYMFHGCKSLTTLDLRNLDTSNVTNMSHMFWDCSSLASLDLSNFDTSNVTMVDWMFTGCTSLTSLDLSNFYTSNLTRTDHMFKDCSSLTTLNVSNFNTINFNSVFGMFSGCSSLTTLDISNFDTSNITDMRSLFEGCSSLTTLNVSNFNTSNVTEMSGMFEGCSSLTTLDISNFDTSKVEYMSNMFCNCTSLITLDVSNFNTSNVFGMSSMFQNCSSLISLDVANFDTSKLQELHYMFQNCSVLTALDLSNFDTSQVFAIQNMFDGCSSLTTLDISSFDMSSVYYYDDMFSNTNKLEILKTPKVCPITYISLPHKMMDEEGVSYSKLPATTGTSKTLTKLKDMTVSVTNGQAVETGEPILFNGQINVEEPSAGYVIEYCETDVLITPVNETYGFEKVGEEYVSNNQGVDSSEAKTTFSLVAEKDITLQVAYSVSSESDYDIFKLTLDGTDALLGLSGYNSSNGGISGTYSGTLDLPLTVGEHTLIATYSKDSSSSSGEDTVRISLSGFVMLWSTEVPSKTEVGIYEIPYRVTASGYNTYEGSVSFEIISPPKDGEWLGAPYALLDTDGDGVKETCYVYDDMTDTTEITIHSYYSNGFYKVLQDNPTVTKAIVNCSLGSRTGTQCMFYKCNNLESLEFGTNFNTDNSTNMYGMFWECSKLTSLDLSSFNTNQVTSMQCMFASCSKMASVVLTSFNTNNVITMSSMFASCEALTSLNVSNFNTSKATNMNSMFSGCKKLTTLNLSRFDTSNVTNMHYMFYNCYGLTSLGLSNFDTSKVTDMGSMFSGCSGLTTLDLSRFDTSKVTDMSIMFCDCRALKTLNVSSFNTSNVTSMNSMFKNCLVLTSLDLSSFDTSKVTGMYHTFYYCGYNASNFELNISSFNMNNVTDTRQMFYSCKPKKIMLPENIGSTNIDLDTTYYGYASDDSVPDDTATYTKLVAKNPETGLAYLSTQKYPDTLTIVLNNAGDLFGSIDANGILHITGTGTKLDITLEDAIANEALRESITGLSFDTDTIKWIDTGVGKTWCSGVPNVSGNLVLPSKLEGIGCSEFSNCKGFTGALVIPETVKWIGANNFLNCSGFSSLTLPSVMNGIDSYAFSGCSGFKGDLVLPDGLTNLSSCVFNGCSFTGDLVIPASVTSISNYAFCNCKFNGTLTLSNNLVSIGGYAFHGCPFTGSLVIPNSVTSIGDYAFRWAKGFTGDLILHDSITTIGERAFDSCTGLNGTLKLPNGITIISDYTFYDCKFTGKLNLPGTLTSIGSHAFEKNCFNGVLNVNEGVTIIKEYAFASNNIATAVLPNSLEELGNGCFSHCDKLSKLYVGNSVATVGTKCFYVNDNVPTKLYTNSNAVKNYNWAGDNRTISPMNTFTFALPQNITLKPKYLNAQGAPVFYSAFNMEIIGDFEDGSYGTFEGVPSFTISTESGKTRTVTTNVEGMTVTEDGTITVPVIFTAPNPTLTEEFSGQFELPTELHEVLPFAS